MLTSFHLTILFLPSVQLFGVELNCPVFTESVNEIVCRINKTAVHNAACLDVQKYVTFDRRDRNKMEKALCTADNACDPAKNLPSQTCCCDDSDPEIKICKFSHVANRSSDEGAQLECRYCTEPEMHLDVKDESCQNIRFADATTSEEKMIKNTSTRLIGVTFYVVYGSLMRRCWKGLGHPIRKTTSPSRRRAFTEHQHLHPQDGPSPKRQHLCPQDMPSLNTSIVIPKRCLH